MSLNYNFSKVNDFETLHENGREWSKTDRLIWVCMSIGIPSITDDNYGEFYARLHFVELLQGARRTEDGKSVYFTVDDVKRRIGLTTNVSKQAHAQFVKMVTDRFFTETKQAIEFHEEKL